MRSIAQGQGSPRGLNSVFIARPPCRCSLYVKNLDESTRDEDLKEAFSEFGTVKAVHLLREADGNLRGYGFIRFASPEEAARALQSGQGRTVKNKQVFLAHAQRRNEMRNYTNFQVTG